MKIDWKMQLLVVGIGFRDSLRHRVVVLEERSRLAFHGKLIAKVNASASVAEIVSHASAALRFEGRAKRSETICSRASDVWI